MGSLLYPKIIHRQSYSTRSVKSRKVFDVARYDDKRNLHPRQPFPYAKADQGAGGISRAPTQNQLNDMLIPIDRFENGFPDIAFREIKRRDNAVLVVGAFGHGPEILLSLHAQFPFHLLFDRAPMLKILILDNAKYAKTRPM